MARDRAPIALLSLRAALAGVLVAVACRDEGSDAAEPLPEYQVQGDMGPRSQAVTVKHDGVPITDAGALTGQITTGSVMDIRGLGIPATIQITGS